MSNDNPTSNAVAVTLPPRKLGVFWGLRAPERDIWFDPVNAAYARIIPFFNGTDDAFDVWSSNRWNGANPASPPGDLQSAKPDKRALGLAVGIRDLPSRIQQLVGYTCGGPAAIDHRILKLAQNAVAEFSLTRGGAGPQPGPDETVAVGLRQIQHETAGDRLAEAWACAAVGGDIGDFEQSLGAVAFFLHLLLTRSPAFL